MESGRWIVAEENVQNELLEGIQNELAMIRKFLEVLTVKALNLNEVEVDLLKEESGLLTVHTDTHCKRDERMITRQSDMTVGASPDMGLYQVSTYNMFVNGQPRQKTTYTALGKDENRTRPMNEDGDFLFGKELEEWEKQEKQKNASN